MKENVDITPASAPKPDWVEKLIMYAEDEGTVVFDLNHVYKVEKFMNIITEKLKGNSANYIELSCDSREDASEVYITFISGRDETDEECSDRMFRNKMDEDAFKAKQENDEYIKFLSLKAKFENDLSSL